MSLTRRSGALLVGALALLVRSLHLATAKGPWWDDPLIDGDYNDFLGVELAAGRGIPPGPFWQPPLYPWVLGALYRVVGHHLWAPRLAQSVLGALVAMMTFDLARAALPGRPRLALSAGLLCALHGVLVFYAGELLPTSLGIFFITLALWRASVGAPSPEHAVQAGVATGLAALALPATLPALLAIGAQSARGDRRRWLLVLVAAAITIAPATLINVARSRELVLISANAGVNLWIGNNPDGEKLQLARPGAGWEALMAEPDRAGAHSLAQADAFFTREALRYCASAPARCAQGLARKARLLLSSRELPRNEDLAVVRQRAPVLAALTPSLGSAHLPHALLLPLAIAGGVHLARRREGRGVTLAALCLASTPLLFFVTARYRAPLGPALCVLAAAGLAAIIDRNRAAIASALAALVLALWPVQTATDAIDFEAEAYFVIGGRRARLGDDRGAISAWQQALERDPSYLEPAFNLALAFERTGDLPSARQAYRALLRHHPSFAPARERLHQRSPSDAR